jgi:hypothetical protein
VDQIAPSRPQAAPRRSWASHRMTGEPPETATFYSFPNAMKATHTPSGEKKGFEASSVPQAPERQAVHGPHEERRVAGSESKPATIGRKGQEAAAIAHQRFRRRQVEAEPRHASAGGGSHGLEVPADQCAGGGGCDQGQGKTNPESSGRSGIRRQAHRRSRFADPAQLGETGGRRAAHEGGRPAVAGPRPVRRAGSVPTARLHMEPQLAGGASRPSLRAVSAGRCR